MENSSENSSSRLSQPFLPRKQVYALHQDVVQLVGSDGNEPEG